VLLWVLAGSRLAEEQERADMAAARAAQLEQQAAALRDINTLDTELDTRAAAIQAALAGDVAWTRFIQEVATVMPGDVWITTFSGVKAVTAAADGGAGSLGSANFSLMGFDHTSTARWIMRLGSLPSLSGLWVPASTKSTGTVTFTSSAQITTAAQTQRAAEFAPERNP